MNVARVFPPEKSFHHHGNARNGPLVGVTQAILRGTVSLKMKTSRPGKTRLVPPIHQARKWYVPEASEECGAVRWRPGRGTDAPAERT